MSLEDLVRKALVEQAGVEAPLPDVNALATRGVRARRRRRLVIAASVAAVALVGAAAVAGPMVGLTVGPPPVAGSRSSAGPVASAAPRTGSGFFAGSANVPVSFAVPPGWETSDSSFVVKSGADPAFGVGFYDVANIYTDGCRWVQADPPVGPTVDDLVKAFRSVTELKATPARAVTVDGFDGQQIEFSVPAHDPASCQDATFALIQADNAGSNVAQPGAPNLWALTPDQQNQVFILDVDGTRLAVFAVHPPDISADDRAAIDAILASLRIG